jgi:hypothetical protein
LTNKEGFRAALINELEKMYKKKKDCRAASEDI